MPSLFFIMICLIGLTARAGDSQPQKPNVLFIAVDDLRVELSCYGNDHVKSPHLDQFAKQSTLFTHAYCQQSLCNPSRASVLTGLRPDTLRVWDLHTHFRENYPKAETIPQLFKRSGYHAQCIGKIFHNWRQDDYRGDPASWSVPSILHYNTHSNDKPQIDGKIPLDHSTLKLTECRDVPDSAYFDGRVADEAIKTLRQMKSKPFFLAVGFWKPHLPFNAPKKYWDLYDRNTLPVPDHLHPPKDVPEVALTSARIGKISEDDLRELHHGHLAAISYLDAQIGRVLSELDSLGLRKNSVIVFWSDHGLHLGEHGLMRKTTVFDLDTRVPLMISAPDHKEAQQTDAIVELIDLYPTLVELCGLETNSKLEGKSLVPLLEDPNRTVKPFALSQAPRPNYLRGKLPETMGYSITNQQFRYTEWRNWKDNKVQARELYHRVNDPNERVNIARNPRYAKEIEGLSRELQSSFFPSHSSLNSH